MNDEDEQPRPSQQFGELLVPEDSFLRRLPRAIHPEQRMRFDALVFSSDAVAANWTSLGEIAVRCEADVNRVGIWERAGLLSSAWSIVDELDAARQIMWALIGPPDDKDGPLTSRLRAELATVQRLRNRMRHLSGNLRAIGAAEQKPSALFGSLSWFYCPDPRSAQGDVMLVQSGILYGSTPMNVINPAGRRFRPPVDHFQLQAFGIQLQLRSPIEALADWLRASTPSWEAEVRATLEAHVSAKGGKFEDLWSHDAGGLTVALKMEFGGDGAPPKFG